MTEQAAARRMRILEELLQGGAERDLTDYAHVYSVDERTVRRDVDYLQDIVAGVSQIGLKRGRVFATRGWRGPGYFGRQVEMNREAKQTIAAAVVEMLPDNVAIAVTAGSTTYHVARELRRTTVEEKRPENLIAFTNSLPALMEMIAAGISTGVIGEIYNADDCAFHSNEFRSAFQPSIVIVGASGVVANPGAGLLELYTHRAEEAAFLKQLIAPVPELIVAVDASKIGHRHPWSFTSGGVLTGKKVKLVTSALQTEVHETLSQLEASAHRSGCAFSYLVA
jgi:DeoR/GlpR family transcriptional regulator of sugar metabolism